MAQNVFWLDVHPKRQGRIHVFFGALDDHPCMHYIDYNDYMHSRHLTRPKIERLIKPRMAVWLRTLFGPNFGAPLRRGY